MFSPTEQWNLADMAKRKSIQTVAEAIFQHLQARNPNIKEWVEWFDYPKEIVVRLRGTDFEAVDFTTSYGQKLLKQLQELVDVQSLVDQGDNQELKKFLAIKKQREELEEEYERLRYYVARIARIAGGSVRLGRYEFTHDIKFVRSEYHWVISFGRGIGKRIVCRVHYRIIFI